MRKEQRSKIWKQYRSSVAVLTVAVISVSLLFSPAGEEQAQAGQTELTAVAFHSTKNIEGKRFFVGEDAHGKQYLIEARGMKLQENEDGVEYGLVEFSRGKWELKSFM